MKKTILMAIAALLVCGAARGGLTSEEPGELTVAGQFFMPGVGDFDLFDSGYGASISYREWFMFPFGAGVSLGVSQWQVDSGADAYKDNRIGQYDGDAMVIPLGASLYFNLIDWDNWNLILDTGLQYALVDSNVSAHDDLQNRDYDVDIGDAVLWNVGLEYEYMVTENLFLLGGGGYQTDVLAAETDYNGVDDARDTSFQGAYIRLGAKYLF